MQNIVTMMNSEPRVGSKMLAEGFGIGHPPVQKLIQKYRAEMEEMGEVMEVQGRFSKTNLKLKNTDQATLEYFLNEQQAVFFGQLTRNSEISVKFKLNLTKEFFRMRGLLNGLNAHKSTEEWQATRIEGKAHRKGETEVIKKFVEYARSQGSENADKYYTSITKAENAALFVIAGKYQNLRDMMSSKQLFQIACADQLVEKALTDGMARDLPYKDVFQLLKSEVQKFGALMGKSDIIAQQLALI